MNEQDIELYHYMLNIELKQFINNFHLSNRNESKFSSYVIKEFKRLKREKKLSSSGFRHFHSAFLPTKKGFKIRWNKRLNRYRDIYNKNAKIQNQTPSERLNGFFSELARYQFIIKIKHDDEIAFNESESPTVLSLGFVGIHKDQVHKLNTNHSEIILTYYIGESGLNGETMLLYHLQNYGFNIALEHQRSHIRLAHNTFSWVFIESFHEKLGFTIEMEDNH